MGGCFGALTRLPASAEESEALRLLVRVAAFLGFVFGLGVGADTRVGFAGPAFGFFFLTLGLVRVTAGDGFFFFFFFLGCP